MKSLLQPLILLLAALISQPVFAHAEHDKARFVAETGTDQGRCDNRFRPCQSISYAFQQANKGDVILVAKGQYSVQSTQALFELSGQLVSVKAGYSQIDGYQVQSPNQHPSILLGVPLDQAPALTKQGFTVIVDQKNQQSLSLHEQMLTLMNSRQSATDCVDGSAGGYACENISLLSHLPLSEFSGNPASAKDIWGHVDLNTGQEYAIIGLSNGISVVNVTDPESPEIVGHVSGANSGWRDVKVYQFYDAEALHWRAYAYATAESDASEGLTIIDLNGLSQQQVSVVERQQSDRSAHNLYISNLDYSFNIALNDSQPLVHIVGSNNFGGASRSYALTDPEALGATYSPTTANRSDYSHDVSSVLINDGRAQSDCNNSTGQDCLVLLDFNENTLRLQDHTDINNQVLLGEVGYLNSAYTHSGWWSEDKNYVFLHDELDERDLSLNTTVRVFDITDLTQPSLVGSWVGPTGAIDHNGYVRGNRYYMSNYTRGLTVLDISDATAPEQIGYFDTFPNSDSSAFFGAWGVYPFLPSGNILVSDINSGLFVLKDDTKAIADIQIQFTQSLIEAEEGNTATIEVEKIGLGETQITYEFLLGSSSPTDFNNLATGALQWAAAEQNSQNIQIEIPDDGADEIDESLFVRLTNPTNGAVIGQLGISQIKVLGNVTPAGIIKPLDTTLSVRENQSSLQIEFTRAFFAEGEITVDYQLVSDSAQVDADAVLAPGQLVWADGESQLQALTLQIIDDDIVEFTEQLTLALSTDDEQALSTKKVLISILDDEANEAPTVDAGEDIQVNARQSIVLTASTQDENPQTLRFNWQQTAGESVSLTAIDTSELSFIAPDQGGTLSFAITVTDEFDVSAEDEINVTVIATTTPTTPDNSNNTGGGGSMYWLVALSFCLCAYRSAHFSNKRTKSRSG